MTQDAQGTAPASAPAQPGAPVRGLEIVDPWQYNPTTVDHIFDILVAFDWFTPWAAIYLTIVHGQACFVVPRSQYPRLRDALTPPGLPPNVAEQVRIRPKWITIYQGKCTYNVDGHRRRQAHTLLRASGLAYYETVLSCIFARDTRPRAERPRKRTHSQRATRSRRSPARRSGSAVGRAWATVRHELFN